MSPEDNVLGLGGHGGRGMRRAQRAEQIRALSLDESEFFTAGKRRRKGTAEEVTL